MTINELSRFDSVKATVWTKAKNDGYYLRINGLEEAPLVLVYNCDLVYGQEIIVSILKISVERNYILTQLDSVCERENEDLLSA